jgi:hypothetical protein
MTHFASCLACGELFDAPDDDQDLYCSGCLDTRVDEVATRVRRDAQLVDLQNQMDKYLQKISDDIQKYAKELPRPSRSKGSAWSWPVRPINWSTRSDDSSE